MPQTRQSGTPRWVKVFSVVGVILVVAFAVFHLTGHGLGDFHGISQHAIP